jgi:hypothetical protein
LYDSTVSTKEKKRNPVHMQRLSTKEAQLILNRELHLKKKSVVWLFSDLKF